jgi:membrane protease YdiL (CAAX protease family)
VTDDDPAGEAALTEQALGPHELGTAPRAMPVVVVLGTLVVSNVMANEVLPSWAYVPWNCGVAVVLVVTAMRLDGCSADDLGLATRRIPSGLRWGGAVSAAVLAGYLAALAIPATRDLFNDERADVGLLDMLVRTLVMIPLGTVLMEEIAFRGVLPAMFRRRLGSSGSGALRADVAAALLFGLWHVLPSLDLNDANPVLRDLLPGPLGQLATIAGGVVATAAAGMALSWLRNRSGSLVAPAMLHCSTNSIGYVLAWFVQRA